MTLIFLFISHYRLYLDSPLPYSIFLKSYNDFILPCLTVCIFKLHYFLLPAFLIFKAVLPGNVYFISSDEVHKNIRSSVFLYFGKVQIVSVISINHGFQIVRPF